jgi:hypothetical protein
MRYDDLLDRGPDAKLQPYKMLRKIDMDGYHVCWEAWWLDADGYPTHPVDADDDH